MAIESVRGSQKSSSSSTCSSADINGGPENKVDYLKETSAANGMNVFRVDTCKIVYFHCPVLPATSLHGITTEF